MKNKMKYMRTYESYIDGGDDMRTEPVGEIDMSEEEIERLKQQKIETDEIVEVEDGMEEEEEEEFKNDEDSSSVRPQQEPGINEKKRLRTKGLENYRRR